MWKITRKITKETKDGESMESVYDRRLDESVTLLMGMLFSLATLCKITPKRFAQEYFKNRAGEYASKFRDETQKIEAKLINDLKAKINKPKKK